ncbi:MAG: glycine cleavage system protein GcvH [Thermoplasmata archaeon]|nr:MAG: glycine cleavage system protein GcvH [Thermoplasmata archaeon]
MEIRDNVLYTETHEWVLKKDGTARIGVTDHAQETLTDVVFVELPDVGKEFKKGDVLATLESVKSVAEVYSPLSGTIQSVNERLHNEPGLINSSPYDEGWLVEMRIQDEGELKQLLSPEAYAGKIE